MKWIAYNFKSTMQAWDDEKEEVVDKEIICTAKVEYSEEKLEQVKSVAIDEPTIEDDGQPEPVAEPTEAERLEALEAAMLELMGVETDG